MSDIRHDWTTERVEALYHLPLTELLFQRADRSPPLPRSRNRPALHAAEHQDRRLPGRLRLLSAERALQHGRRARRADEAGGRAGGGAAGARERIDALLHGRGLARSARRRGVRCGALDGGRRGGARHGSLHDARHADGRAGAPSEVGRPHRLQPQPRHVARVLSERSSRRARIRNGSTRCSACRTPASASAAAASSAWASRRAIGAPCWRSLAGSTPHPESLPVNVLVRTPGTPLADADDLDPIELVRTVASARLVAPEGARAVVGRPARADGRSAGAVLHGGRELDFSPARSS